MARTRLVSANRRRLFRSGGVLLSAFTGALRTRFAFPAHLLAVAALAAAAPASAAHDPSVTATIFVHGFSQEGASRSGPYGDEVPLDPAAASIIGLAGLPVLGRTPEPPPPNVVASTNYYGNVAPAYYTEADLAEIQEVTAQWGGGVPRYALIVAKFARHVMERSGAQQVNFVSGSFGSLVVRWLIEKNIGFLASDGKIARWMSIEGVLGGSWAASRAETLGLLDVLDLHSIDYHHMGYGWVDAQFHPRLDANNPLYGSILLGTIASTDDTDLSSALSVATTKIEHFRPNDSIQLLEDTYFHVVTEQSRLMGMPPTLSVFNSTHDAIQNHSAAYVQLANFLLQNRRVTITMTSSQILNLHEPQEWYWDLRPAEVILQTRVYSPTIARWGIHEAVSARGKEGGVAPIRRYRHNGETQWFRHVVFDDFVLPDEDALVIDLHAEEVDNNWRYGVYESTASPSYDEIGGGKLMVNARTPGTYTFRAGDWVCTFEVSVFEYPFGSGSFAAKRRAARDPALPSRAEIALWPNPFTSNVRIAVTALSTAAAEAPATLSIHDLSGRLVRRMTAPAGASFDWDGRDDEGRSVPPGVYLHRLVTADRTFTGRSLRLR